MLFYIFAQVRIAAAYERTTTFALCTRGRCSPRTATSQQSIHLTQATGLCALGSIALSVTI